MFAIIYLLAIYHGRPTRSVLRLGQSMQRAAIDEQAVKLGQLRGYVDPELGELVGYVVGEALVSHEREQVKRRPKRRIDHINEHSRRRAALALRGEHAQGSCVTFWRRGRICVASASRVASVRKAH
jgi:hypothetical protein